MDHNKPTLDSVIYKIVPEVLWMEMVETGQFSGSEIDLIDGFIHFSCQSQVEETASKHFTAQPNLKLVAIDSTLLGNNLKWERSRGGDLFPHLYAPLKQEAVLWSVPLPLAADGSHIFPQELPR